MARIAGLRGGWLVNGKLRSADEPRPPNFPFARHPAAMSSDTATVSGSLRLARLNQTHVALRLTRRGEAIYRATRPHIDTTTAESRRGVHLLFHVIHPQHFPLRSGLQHRNLALAARCVHLCVSRHRRGEVLARSLGAPPLFQHSARCGIEGCDDTPVLYQVKDALIYQRRGDIGQVPFEPPRHGLRVDLALGWPWLQRDGAKIPGRNDPPCLIPLPGRQPMILIRIEPAEVSAQIGIVFEFRFGQLPVSVFVVLLEHRSRTAESRALRYSR